MKLLALHLTNVRKFTGKRASITGIGNGITVVSEANEFGKSTFFDAIHALFFEKFSSAAKSVKSLQPYAGGAVEVAADIETEDGSFRVEKRFLSKKSARISRLPDGATVAQDDEAERWISTLLGATRDGPAGLLWVRQGLLGLEPDSAKEKSHLMETRRDLLSSVAGEIDAMTGGRRMDRVMRRVADSLGEITTKTGRKSGEWKVVSDEVAAFEAELASVSTQLEALDNALRDRKLAEATLTRLDNADAKARRDAALSAAKAAMEVARAHAGAVKAARQECELARLNAKSAEAALDGFLTALDALQSAEKLVNDSAAAAEDAKQAAGRKKAVRDSALAAQNDATAAISRARAQLDAARNQMAAHKAKAEAAHLATQITKAETALADRDAARATVKASGATAEWLQQVERAEAEVVKLGAAAKARATTLGVFYSGAARITQNGIIVPDDQPVTLDEKTVLDLPGIGKMTIYTQGIGQENKAELAKTEEVLKHILAKGSADTLQAARALAATRASAENMANLAGAVLDTLAPNGIGALRAAKADTDLAAHGGDNQAHAEITDLELALAQAEAAEAETQRNLKLADEEHAQARETNIKCQADAETARQGLERAKAAAGSAESHGSRRTELLRRQAQEKEVLFKADSELQALIAAAPDKDTAAAELKRAEDAVNAVRQERIDVDKKLAALSSKIQTFAGNSIEEHHDTLTGQLEASRATEARFARQAAALTRLQTALESEREAARETYFGPVQEELKPLLSILHQNAALSFDSESLLPSGLMRGQTEETLDDLSGGTQEQVSILTRLAFARLFARQGRHMPIILDDALVYSDDDRIIKMFTALTRVAADQQILVFSCRQLAFQDLGGARPKVEISDI